ncbi:response regulator [Patulibacter medicamentivorans]|uniref:response regulator n=1 Tax=Patulibacter medicamentivorans TaxID=1097667 RepID=UPI00058B4CC6|nr:response regulator transcription factor [Patulibacter medicamentivorans]
MSAYRARVVIVDDHAIFRAGVRAELAAACEVVGEAGDVGEALAVIRRTEPDVVLLDVHLPGGGGVAVLEGLPGLDRRPSVLALSVSDAAEDVVAVIRAGALGYVTKTIVGDALVAAIDRTREGEPVFGPRLAGFVLQAFSGAGDAEQEDDLDRLTPREREVLLHLARGYAYKAIALRMEISPRTVESHVGAVLRKLQLTSRHEVSHWAARRGMLDGEDE